MDPVLVLAHGDDIPPGLLGLALERAGIPQQVVRVHAGESLPQLDGFAGLAVLGGVMGAYDVEDNPWLADEKQLISVAHRTGVPTLGICLGAQLAADALGGRAYRIEGVPEIAHLCPSLTAAGRDDPVLREFDQPVVTFHQDTFDLPPGAVALAHSERFVHAFRLGSIVAVQAHPEADAAIVEQWVKQPEDISLLEAAGVEPSELMAWVRAGEVAQREMAARLFGAWAEEAVRNNQ